jgi:ABC-type enterochelin transport system permease subunit
MHLSQTYQVFSERATKLTSTMEILILGIALIIAMNDFVIRISVTGFVRIFNLNTGTDMSNLVLISVSISFRISASIGNSIGISVGNLPLTQPVPCKLPQ